MECGDKSPLSKAVLRHRTSKNGVFRGWCPPLNPDSEGDRFGGLRLPRGDIKEENCVTPNMMTASILDAEL